MDYNYLTSVQYCSPVVALQNLNLRKFVLPFDWITSDISILENCFKSNFDKFHKNLIFNRNKTRLIDYWAV